MSYIIVAIVSILATIFFLCIFKGTIFDNLEKEIAEMEADRDYFRKLYFEEIKKNGR